jgi:hypothetical protein
MIADWTEFIIGIIMIVSPWILGFSDITLARWCNVSIGIVLVLISAWAIFGGSTAAPAAASESGGKKKKEKEPKNNVEK